MLARDFEQIVMPQPRKRGENEDVPDLPQSQGGQFGPEEEYQLLFVQVLLLCRIVSKSDIAGNFPAGAYASEDFLQQPLVAVRSTGAEAFQQETSEAFQNGVRHFVQGHVACPAFVIQERCDIPGQGLIEGSRGKRYDFE